VIDFKISKDEEDKLQAKFFLRLKNILDNHLVEYEDKILIKLIRRYYPDWRRLLNETQRHAATGKIDSVILVDISDVNLDDLIRSLKNKEFTVVKKWVVENINNDPSYIMRKIYDSLYDHLKSSSIPEAVLIIAKYMKDITIVPDQEINLLACLTEIMMSCEFK
jgi:replication factor C small subunit